MLVHRFAPFPTGEPGAYALVGMGTLFAGIIRAPMTSVFMIFEITQDYQILVPLMVANLLSFMISRRYQPSRCITRCFIKMASTCRRRPRQPVPGTWTAAEAMVPAPSLVEQDAVIQSVRTRCTRPSGGGAVARGGGLAGVVTRATLIGAAASGRGRPLRTLLEGPPAHLHPDHAADMVIERVLGGGGMLPVVSRERADQVWES